MCTFIVWLTSGSDYDVWESNSILVFLKEHFCDLKFVYMFILWLIIRYFNECCLVLACQIYLFTSVHVAVGAENPSIRIQFQTTVRRGRSLMRIRLWSLLIPCIFFSHVISIINWSEKISTGWDKDQVL